jgi:hypothetical protein
MIHNIFLPQKIGDYYLFKKRIVSFSIFKESITALSMTLHARTKTINHVISEPILFDQYESADLAIIGTIKKIIENIGSYDELSVVMNSSYGIFKELTIPLLDEEKIAQIVGFELENFLPFPIANAVFDFIITEQNAATHTSDIFAVAIQKEKIDTCATLFSNAGINVNRFLVDVFNLYDLFLATSTPSEKGRLVVTSDHEKTIALYLEKNKLKKIRILQEAAIHDNDAWWKAITFTFESCTENWIGEKEIIFYGNYSSEIIAKAEVVFSTNLTALPLTYIFEKLTLLGDTTQNNVNITLADLAATLDLPVTDGFNLKQENGLIETTLSAISNYITASVLLVLLYGSFGIHMSLEVQKFSKASEKVKIEIMKDLKSALPSLKATSPAEAIRKAKAEITKEEDIWFSFSSQTRHSFLTYLFNLSTIVDRQTLGLNLKKMTFNRNGIILDGNVKSFDAVEELIKQLKNTHLFTQVPNLQKTEFSMPLTLIDQEEGS